MRHCKRRGKLNRTSSHRGAMLSNMSVALICHEQIVTTLPKAKQLRPVVEKLVTASRSLSLSVRRRLVSKLRSDEAVCKLLRIIGPRYIERPGGYLRIVKLGKARCGDAADMAVIEFVGRNVCAKGVSLRHQLSA